MERSHTACAGQPLDSDAAVRLIDRHGTAVYRFCRSLTYSKEDAEDLFQETFLHVLEKPRRFQDSETAQRLLFSTSLFLWKSWKRKYARRSRLAPTGPMDEAVLALDSGVNLEEELLNREQQRQVRALVDDLPDKYKIPTILYYASEQTTGEIAALLRLPEGTVKSRLHKARERIKKGLVSSDDETP